MEDLVKTLDGDYSDESFWAKLKQFALKAGKELVEKALWLYYAAKQEGTPPWAKVVIFGALAYFISPIDAIPDAIPVFGLTDDLAVIAAAVGTVIQYVDDDVRQRTTETMHDWFGGVD